MKWIRVAVDIMDDSSIDTLAASLKVRVAEAVGCVVCVLAHLPADAPDGNIASKSDRLIEKWAEWEGKRGAFAPAFRATFCTEAGVVRSWDKHNGAALREAERQRYKMQKYRQLKEDVPGTVPGTVPVTESDGPSIRDGTGRDGTYSQPPKDDGEGNLAAASSSARQAFDQIAPCVAPVGRDALRYLLGAVDQPETWAGIIRGCASGQSMPEGRPASAERIAAAVQDFVAAGHHTAHPPKVKLFRGFVANSKASAAQTRHWLNVDEDKADELRTIREQNDRRRMRNEPPKPLPTWAAEIDAKFPDGRTWPGGVAA